MLHWVVLHGRSNLIVIFFCHCAARRTRNVYLQCLKTFSSDLTEVVLNRQLHFSATVSKIATHADSSSLYLPPIHYLNLEFYDSSTFFSPTSVMLPLCNQSSMLWIIALPTAIHSPSGVRAIARLLVPESPGNTSSVFSLLYPLKK